MPTLVLDPPPAQLQELLEHRRRIGADHHDEMWQGVLHMAPAPRNAHADVQQQLSDLLGPLALRAGLHPLLAGAFNLGEPQDYRVPDGGLLRDRRDATWNPTAALVVEIVSPGDESWEKFPFYAAHGVDEVLIVDPAKRTCDWLALREGEYRPIERSGLIDLGASDLAERIDWPPTE
ncbi:MAG: Uma2 family endonuclease [Solirubrobacteraceae bacterium]